MAREVGYPVEEPPGPIPRPSHTRSLAVVVFDIASPFCLDIIRGAFETAWKSGYPTLLSQTRGGGRLERDWTERELVAVDGVLLAGSGASHDAIRSLAKKKPLVMLNRRVPDVLCVVPDIAGMAIGLRQRSCGDRRPRAHHRGLSATGDGHSRRPAPHRRGRRSRAGA